MRLTINDIQVMNEKEVKFLGIYLDNRLNFRKQTQEVRSKVFKANMIMSYLNKKSRGMEVMRLCVNTALMLYKNMVRSVTDYAIFVYYPKEKTYSLKIERAQFLGIRKALGYRNSTPNNVIIAEAKVKFLKDRAKMLACLQKTTNTVYEYYHRGVGESKVDREENSCQAVLLALQNNTISVYHNRYVIEIKEIQDRLEQQHEKRILYVWIPAHMGIKGNEWADTLAKEATEEEVIEIPVWDYRPIFKKETWNDTQDTLISEV
ncbi:uncharacterized protein [Linepithema humile]|uniref:uncharacterized protein n=1 Tax=Linepithema humile TaxID=83485 RepID=UPI00351EAC98